MRTTLLIMAAGLGSRYGGIKQLAGVDDAGHIIMDYSVHDAIKAGFKKIVFIIRREIEEDFRRVIGSRVDKVCDALGVEVSYVFQDMANLPEGFLVPEGRKKPWGTGQAVLSAKAEIEGPFVVINADDYYGKEAYVQLQAFLSENREENGYCMAGFVLENTLSENGGVTRGICRAEDNGRLVTITETDGILRTEDGIRAGAAVLDGKTPVSMNMWGFTPGIFGKLERGFTEFLRTDAKKDPLKAEFLLPVYIGKLLQENAVSVQVLPTGDKWFGVTYQEDRENVVQSIRELIETGEYSPDLYSDL